MWIGVHCIVYRYTNGRMLFATKLKIYSHLKHQIVWSGKFQKQLTLHKSCKTESDFYWSRTRRTATERIRWDWHSCAESESYISMSSLFVKTTNHSWQALPGLSCFQTEGGIKMRRSSSRQFLARSSQAAAAVATRSSWRQLKYLKSITACSPHVITHSNLKPQTWCIFRFTVIYTSAISSSRFIETSKNMPLITPNPIWERLCFQDFFRV